MDVKAKVKKVKDSIEPTLNKVDDKRELIEDFVARGLAKIKGNDKIDTVIITAIITGITTANAYATAQYGVPILSDDVKKQIANEVLKGLQILNDNVAKQLEKKSKKYKERHNEF